MASLTHLMGIGGVTTTTARYRARADEAATLKIEYSTASDLSGSTTSAGVAVVSGDDFTGGESISGLTTDTTYYYSILVDDARAHSAPYPQFKTFPATGTVKVVWGSCQNSPTQATIYAAMAAESPDLFLHLGDNGYPDTTVLADQRTSYKSIHASDYLNEIVRKFPRAHTWDDHDFGANNSTGDLADKANSLQAFKEYTPLYDLENASQGIWHSFTLAHAEFFVLDTRYQREGGKARFQGSSGTNAAASGTTTTSLVLGGSPNATDDFYNGWYAEAEGVVARITDYNGTTKACTLNRTIPGLASGSQYYIRRASMLDMDVIADGQVEWLIAALNASTATWKVLCTSVPWNPSNTADDDTWGAWDADQAERKYIQQLVTAENVIVLSADRHWCGIDSGANSLWPEGCASPFNQTAVSLGGTWSNGTYGAGRAYGVLTLTARAATFTVKNATGSTASGITPLTVFAEGVNQTPIPWLRA